MSTSTRLVLKAAPALRVDLRGVVPSALAALDVAAIERLPVGHGNVLLPLAELFSISRTGSADGVDTLVLDGDCARIDRIGWQQDAGRTEVHGNAGDHLGGCMTGGEIAVHGSAGALAACEMAGGRLVVDGDVGDFAASTLPGSMDGMRGGTFIVQGHAGDRFADRMRRGTALVFGDVGDFCASRLVAGTVGIGGTAGAHAGYGQRRGSLVVAGPAFEPSPTFVPALVDAVVFWQLVARDLQQHGGPFAGLARKGVRRYLGDTAAAGKGDLVFAG